MAASIVPYKAFKTSDGDILLGGGNDRLYGILCTKLNRQEWISDARFKTNALRVQNRDTLEDLIERETKMKTTKEWLDILEGCGLRKLSLPWCVCSLLTKRNKSVRRYQRRPRHTQPRTR